MSDCWYTFNVTTGLRLRLLLAVADLTNSELAAASGISAKSLWTAMAEKNEPRESTLHALAGPLGVPVAALLDDEECFRQLRLRCGLERVPPAGIGTETPLVGRVAASLERVPPKRQEHLVTVGFRLRMLIAAANKTNAQVSVASGVSTQALWTIQSGRNIPQESTLRAIAGALGVSVEAITEDASFFAALRWWGGFLPSEQEPPIFEDPLVGRVAEILSSVPPERREYLVTILESLVGAFGERKPVAPAHREPVGRREDDGRDLGDPVAH